MKIILCPGEQKIGKIVLERPEKSSTESGDFALEGQKNSSASTENGKIVLGGSVSGGKWSVQKLP